MSRYTTQVKTICEYLAGINEPSGYEDIDEILEVAAPKIFSFDFPIFDEEYRIPLCKKILKKFYTREIGQETYGLWKLRLDVRMNEIMPRLNKLYESELIKFDPLNDTDYTIEHDNIRNDAGIVKSSGSSTQKGVSNDNSTSKSTSNAESYDLYSDTPQNGLNGINSIFPPTNGEESEEYQGYLTNASKNVGDSESVVNTVNGKAINNESEYSDSVNNNRNITEALREHVKGHKWLKSKSLLLMEYRDTAISPDEILFKEIDDLFIQLYD